MGLGFAAQIPDGGFGFPSRAPLRHFGPQGTRTARFGLARRWPGMRPFRQGAGGENGMDARLTLHPTLRRALAPVRRLVPAVVALGLLATALEGIGIGLLIPLLQLATGQGGAPGGFSGWIAGLTARFPAENRALFIGLAILALIGLKNLVAYGNGVLQAWIYGRCSHHIRTALSSGLLAAGSGFCLTSPTSRLLNTLSTESWRAADAVAAFLSLLVAAAATAIFAAFLMALSPQLTLIVLLGLGLMHLAQDRLTRHVLRLGQEVADLNQGLAGRMLHLVTAWRLIRLFLREADETARFAAASDAVRHAGLRLNLRQAAVGPLIEVAYALLFLIVAYAAWRLGTTFGQAAAFSILLYRLQPQIRTLQSAAVALRGWTGSLDEVGWLLSQPPQPRRPGLTASLAPLTRGLRFQAVSFRYARDSADAVAGLTFDLPMGEATAIVGRSGSGKSTVANLICGLLAPTAGRILADDTDLASLAPEAWLSRIAVASQELELFDASVIDNILYGAPGAGAEAALQAARDAGAEDFIRALPQGHLTRLGNRGGLLSAGQRQRVALARALVRQPEILILDEATNALDTLSESIALRMIKRRRGRAMTLVISHHLSSIRLCPHYLHFDQGRLVGRGATGGLEQAVMDRMLARGGAG